MSFLSLLEEQIITDYIIPNGVKGLAPKYNIITDARMTIVMILYIYCPFLSVLILNPVVPNGVKNIITTHHYPKTLLRLLVWHAYSILTSLSLSLRN